MLDLGSGAGKVCFIATQTLGPAGSVLRVDINDDMCQSATAPVRCTTDRSPRSLTAQGCNWYVAGRRHSGRRTCADVEGNCGC
ncbi:hypothetical protein ACQPZZ_16540 [Microbispora sp. CA-135349]|uniref:hypothetical protein n=1 Tax=Microbispora sp. CA-135349 TaxID=3239953 RepID=UPI003D9473E1